MNRWLMVPHLLVSPPLPQADQTPVIIEYEALFDSIKESSTMEYLIGTWIPQTPNIAKLYL